MIVELTRLVAERAGPIWGPLGEEAPAEMAKLSVDELKGIIEFFRAGRDLNERHIERVRKLSFD